MFGEILASVAGSALSGLLGDKGSGATQTNEPWKELQPYLKNLYAAGQRNLLDETGGRYTYYPGQTTALRPEIENKALDVIYQRLLGNLGGPFGSGFAPASQQMSSLMGYQVPSLKGYKDLARGKYGPTSTPAGQAAMAALLPTAGGRMLESNPYLDSMFGTAARGVSNQFRNATMPGLQSMFSAAGRYGPGAAMGSQFEAASEGLGNTLNSLAANIYGSNYANERGLQMNAANQLGNLGVADIQSMLSALQGQTQAGQYQFQNQLQLLNPLLQYANQDFNQALSIADRERAATQQAINANIDRYNFNTQQGGYMPLQQFASLLGAVGTPSSSNYRQQGDLLGNLFGGAMMGNSLYNMFRGGGGGVDYGLGGSGIGLGGGTSGYGLNPFAPSGLGLKFSGW